MTCQYLSNLRYISFRRTIHPWPGENRYQNCSTDSQKPYLSMLDEQSRPQGSFNPSILDQEDPTQYQSSREEVFTACSLTQKACWAPWNACWHFSNSTRLTHFYTNSTPYGLFAHPVFGVQEDFPTTNTLLWHLAKCEKGLCGTDSSNITWNSQLGRNII